MKIEFKDHVVLVTGATRGIGQQIAADFLQLGAQAILTGTKQEEIEALNQKCVLENIKARYYCVDFSDRASLAKFLDQLKAYARIDVCINNAGINKLNNIDEAREEDWDMMMDVNLRAPYMLMRVLSRKMKKNQYGRIVNISSIFGTVSRIKRSMYSTTKFGIRGMTVAAALELAKDNVLINTVSPGFIQTDLTMTNLSVQEREALADQVPMKRFGKPEEISRIVLFLSSSLNTYMTGQDIVVDGGYISE